MSPETYLLDLLGIPLGVGPGRTRLMRIFEPLKFSSYTHPRRESESVHVFRGTFLTPHIPMSSSSRRTQKDMWCQDSSGSRSGTLLGSERSWGTCAGGECGMEKNGGEAHIVQIVDESSQILALQTWDSISVFVPAEEADEPAVKMM